MTLPTYNALGQKQTATKVQESIFGVNTINHNLLKLVYEDHLKQKRVNLAQAKNRAAVRGGGKKPWQQKGTGRARVSSIRSPLWKGGGVIFGPTGQENYKQKINKKTKSQALKQALSLKQKQIITLKSLPTDKKTATLNQLLYKTLKLNRKILIIEADIQKPVALASRNLTEVDFINVLTLNVFQVLNADHLIFTPDALAKLPDRFKMLGSQKS